MAKIEHRVESKARTPDYAGHHFDDEAIAKGQHRRFIGGNWDTHGLRQLEFLQSQGLKPSDRFLDVGCGSLRAGRHLIDYLDPLNYYGFDANIDIVQAGYDHELTDEQRERAPVDHFRANDRFDGDFGVTFDMAIAQSVFTHVSLNYVRLCMFRIAKVMRPGGKFYVTFNEQRSDVPVDAIIERPNRKVQLTERNLFWYYRSDIRWATKVAPWEFRYIGKWGHPGGQRMVELTRLADPKPKTPPAPAAAAGSSRADQAARFVRRGRRWVARHIEPS